MMPMSRACVLYASEPRREEHAGCDVIGCICICHDVKPVALHDLRQAIAITVLVIMMWGVIALLLWVLYLMSQNV